MHLFEDYLQLFVAVLVFMNGPLTQKTHERANELVFIHKNDFFLRSNVKFAYVAVHFEKKTPKFVICGGTNK